MSYCRLIVNGRLTREPEVRTTPNGKDICEFGIAWDTGFGEYKKAAFLDCVCFGRNVEFVVKWFSKGDGILVDGVLEMDQWDDAKTGQKRSKHRLACDRITFAEGRKKDKQDRQSDRGDSDGRAASVNGEDPEEIPF